MLEYPQLCRYTCIACIVENTAHLNLFQRILKLNDLWKSENRFGAFLNWNEIEKFRHFGGIRNEEDFLATENGFRRLRKEKPKSIQKIEGLRNQPAS